VWPRVWTNSQDGTSNKDMSLLSTAAKSLTILLESISRMKVNYTHTLQNVCPSITRVNA
jgi:hypothetical protein